MKQTNNAIKFLMAQYRAIFRNANLKMFLAAATAAAALAAGQAQAADPLSTDALWKALEGDKTAGTAQSDYTKIEIQDADAAKYDNTDKEFTLTIVGDENIIAGGAENAVVKAASGTVILNGSEASLKIGGVPSKSGASVSLKDFKALAGTLTIGGSDQNSALDAATITLGGTASTDAGTSVIATIEKNAVLGSSTSAISLNAGAEVKANAAQGAEAKTSKIEGASLTLNDGSKLTVEDAKGLTVNASTVTVSGGAAVTNGAGSTIVLGGNDITFAAGTLSNKGTIDLGTVGSSRQNVSLNVDTAAFNTQLFSGASTLKITGTGSEAAKLAIKLSGDEEVDLVKSGLIDASNGELAANGLSGSTATDVDVSIVGETATATLASDAFDAKGFKSVELSFADMTVGKSDSSTDFTIKGSSVITASSSLKHANAEKGISVVSGGKLNLHNTDAGKVGSIAAKHITLDAGGGAGGKLNVQGNWILPTLDIKTGTAELLSADVSLAKDAILTTKDVTNNLTLTSSTLDVTDGKVQLGESGAVLNTGSKLSIDKTQLYTVDDSGKTVTLVADEKNNKVVTKAIKTDGTGVLEIMNAGEGVSAEVASDIKTKLAYEGFIQFGAGGSITPSTDETVSFNKGTNLDVVGVYNNSQLVMDGSDNTINKNVAAGSLKLNKKDNVGVVDGKGLILSNASTGENMFVQTADGKLGDLQVKDAGAVTLNGAGKVGSINADTAGNGSVLIGSAAYGKQTAVEVSGSIGGTNTVGNVEIDSKASLTISAGEGKDALKAKTFTLNNGGSLTAKGQNLTLGSGSSLDDSTVATINGDLDAGTLNLNGYGVHTIAGNAKVILDELVVNANSTLSVGNDTDPEAGSATVITNALTGEGKLFVDPLPGQQAAFFIAKDLGGQNKSTLNGDILVGQNAAVGLGFSTEAQMLEVVGQYLDKEYSFKHDEGNAYTDIANALVLGKSITVKTGKGISLKADAKPSDNATANHVVLGAQTALVVTDKVFDVGPNGVKSGAAITVDNGGALDGNGGKIILAGNFDSKDNLTIVADKTGPAKVTGEVVVTSTNGLLYGKINSTSKGRVQLDLLKDKAAEKFAATSSPVSDLLIRTLDGEFKGNTGDGLDFLYDVANNTNGLAADKAARAATYAGAQQAAVAAVGSMAEAVGGRVGSMGVEVATISATGSQANGGVWLSPMYKSVDADGFDAQGASYGADVDLAGVAFGADTVNGNMRFGAVFNIGSGDADGKGNGDGLKDEFDYYGFGMYTVMGFGNFALVGDASLNVISHDVSGESGLKRFGKLKGSADTTAVTMGVTGQYTISNPAVDVTPHVGARFIRLDTDSYDLKSDDGVVASTDFDVQNVFSIPLGVTLSKAFEMGGWSLAPSADLSITFNTGDTEVNSTTQFTGVKAIGLTTEVLDEVTYGVAVGLGAQYGAFGTQIGINYTGSSNTDAFGVNANARYMF